ncbi:MAG: D-alanine--D-alanine ligase [Alphaproteobacteria bacterium]|nr:D-alanine--D-alanine ligase [Alphaproteobacteria bacterium]
MRVTILFGGSSKERLVSVATAQALHQVLPEVDLWFWDCADQVHEVTAAELRAHAMPFEVEFSATGAGTPLDQALDRAREEGRLLLLGLHGGRAENGELQAMCEARNLAFTGSGSASSHLAFDKIAAKRFTAFAGVTSAPTIALDGLEAALETFGRLIAKPARDGSSYGLIMVATEADLALVRAAAASEDYVVEPFVAGREATCGVFERADGTLVALPPVEIVPEAGEFDYAAKYLLKSTQEICPARFPTEVMAAIRHQALRAHRALSCAAYSRSDFIWSEHGLVYLETNTLPGLTATSLFPKALAAQGIRVADFIHDLIVLAGRRAGGR